MIGLTRGGTRRMRGNRHAITIRPLHRRDKPVAQPRSCFDKSRALRQIPEDAAQLVDRCVQAVVERDMGIRPKLLAQALSPYYLPGVLDQRL